ncbi:MAG TPA: F0F1 ATP synthase subunit gamma [Acidimicrobiales bacterium]|nr:F0F1 ATP synthase subunit gamma [Acidimicrobiales bacterium]
MAGGIERALRRRIKSVQSTKKITRAMELIAASRILRAQQRVAASRPYIDQLTEVIRNLAKAGAGLNQPLLVPREDIATVAFVVVTADRGLAGGYNATVERAAERAIAREQAAGRDYRLIVAGKKGQTYFRYRKYRVDAAFTGFSEQPTYENAREIAGDIVSRFEEGEVDQIQLIYTQFLSVGSQRVVERRFVPMDAGAITEGSQPGDDGGGTKAAYEFEPSPEVILEQLLPRYVEGRLFAALLEAAASEQAARQRAMKSATDNANELITTLERVANRARQDTITTEIMEIVGGAEGMAQAGQRETAGA